MFKYVLIFFSFSVLCDEVQPFVQRLTVSHVEAINAYSGYSTNYSSGTVFLSPNYQYGQFMPFVDGRVHRFDNTRFAANIGVGARYIPNNFSHILGANIYYDYRKGHRWDFNQMAFGFEALGCRLDLRANFYLPFGITRYGKTCVFDDYLGPFFAKLFRCESVSWGWNAEIGYLLLECGPFLLYTAAGPYYFGENCLKQRLGFEWRIRPQFRDYFAIDFKVNYDRTYHTVLQTTFILSLPLYQINDRGNCGRFSDRVIYQPVIRNVAMPLSRSVCWDTNFNDPNIQPLLPPGTPELELILE
ncbi:MAG TPA: inverse autotransporter beta domain-containing protein [Chlamydiales bacterium]|nr:inverse autotransporter beta domain-containing protein [Chlamydiales bacterium]